MGENIRRKKMSFHCHFRKISFHVISLEALIKSSTYNNDYTVILSGKSI